MDVTVHNTALRRALGCCHSARNPFVAAVRLSLLDRDQLGGSGSVCKSSSATTPGSTAHRKSDRHPNSASTYAESAAAMTYPTDHPAWSTPSTVVRMRVGTYSAASIVPIVYNPAIPNPDAKRKSAT